ncbi:ABC transporter permease [Helicobacter bizzozeronii]|uniref:ABC transporter permease n=1 Tax=Helicobacter bizzozeronii TaxID=56877 RepID=UPI000CF05FB4|nr:ABC transporter permease [Helicobacter bizzozeronii]
MLAKFLHDKFSLGLCFVAPLVLWGLIAAIFYKEIPTRLNVGVVDLDHSHLSQEIISALNASSYLNLKHFYSGLDQAKPFLANKEIYGVVVLPKNLERQIKLGIKTPVALYYNAEFVLVGKSIANALLQTLLTLGIKNDVARNLATHSNLNTAKALAFPLHVNLHRLYNEDNNYAQFLSSVILPCMWQIIVALGMLNFLLQCSSLSDILGALGLNTAIFGFWGFLMVFFLKPYDAHLGVFLLAVILLVLCVSSVVIALHALLNDPLRTASVIAAYTAPSLAFVGVTYPTPNMPILGEFWGSLLPITYFIKSFIALLHYQEGVSLALASLSKMWFFLLFLPLGLLVHALREKRC